MNVELLSKITSVVSSINFELLFSFAILSISAFILISNWISNIEKYEVYVIDYKLINPGIFQMLIGITNRSSSPLIIKSVSCDESICELEPKKIRGNPGGFGFVSTPRFPVCIPSHGCDYFYLEFLNFRNTQISRGTVLSLEICSTRKSERKTVTLGDISRYLHTREQYRKYLESLGK